MTQHRNTLNVAYAQINTTVGDILSNTAKIISYANNAFFELNADIVIFPELSICGYLPEDLIFRKKFMNDCKNALEHFAKTCPAGLTAIIPLPIFHHHQLMNSAAIVQNNKIVDYCFKHALPNYAVFDEKRYFSPGQEVCVINVKSYRIGIAICEDLWSPHLACQLKEKGAEIIFSTNSSPFESNKYQERISVLKQRIAETKLPILYVNNIGGQDELIFDGGSMLLDKKGEVVQRAPRFKEALLCFHLENEKISVTASTKPTTESSTIKNIYDALVLGVRDYVGKNKFNGVIIGSSGGIDSAVTLAIAVAAVGAANVTAVMMPSCYTASMSLEDAEALAGNLNINHHVIPIKNIFESFLDTLNPQFSGLPVDTTEENIQARCRGTILMALSNKTGNLVLITGNRSEMAVGYATLYGDMAGGFAVLKDVYKQQVYELAEYINQAYEIIPRRVITRAPSAELAPDQKDEDALPPYDTLDKILSLYLDEELSHYEIVQRGFADDTVRRIIKLVVSNEYKRRQSPPGIRINHQAFGRDRRYPITNCYQDY